MNLSRQYLVRMLCAFLASCSASLVVAAGELPMAAQAVVAESLAKAYGAAARIDNPDLIEGFGGGSPFEAFGAAMALDGDTLAVSAPGIYRNGLPRGAVFIFARSGSTWQLQQRIEPSLYLGSGIALSGDRLAVLENEMQSGFVVRSIVRVFRRSAGQWQLESSLSPANAPDGSSVVSQSVALSGDVLAVGLDGIEVTGNVDQGAIDVFSAAGGSWQHQARVNYAGAAPNARVGRSVALRDGLLVAGAPGGIGAAQGAGSVVVFERQSGVWVQRAVLSAADGQAWSEFGASVDTSLGSILVGAPAVDVSGRIDQGASYVFVRSGNSWVQQGKLVAFDGVAQSRFGGAVAMDANLALANGYVFERSGSSWGLRQKLSSARAANALQYGEALIADTWSAHQRGQVEVYAASGPGSFALVETLKLGNGGASRDLFGADVDIEGDVAVIGASRDSLVASYEQGSVTVMRRVADQWQVEAKLVASDGQPSDYLGHSVAISGDTIVAGAWNKTISGAQYAGAAYVFVRSGDQWIQQARLSAAGSLYFGTSVALDGDTIVVGSPGDPGSGGSSGAAYVFKRNAGVWTRTARLLPTSGAYTNFGDRVAVDGDVSMVTSPRGNAPGEVLVFRFNGATWSQQARLQAPDGFSGDNFGSDLALQGNRTAIGAKGQHNGTTLIEGAVYFFELIAGSWSYRSKLRPPPALWVEGFGRSVALDDNNLVVGGWSSAWGAVLSFERLEGNWSYRRMTQSDIHSHASFGASVAMDDRHWIAGQMLADYPDAGDDAGAVFVSSNTHLVETLVDNGGAVTPQNPAVLHGDVVLLQFVPDPGRTLVAAEGCGGVLNGLIFTTSPVTAPCTVTFTTAAQNFSLEYAAGPNGSLIGNASQSVPYLGSGTAISAVPATGYRFLQWSDGSAINPRVDANVTASLQVTAMFANEAPQVSALEAAPSSLFEYEIATISVTASDVESPTLLYAFDCRGDGVFELGPQESNAAVCSWSGPGIYAMAVRVIDGAGAVSTRSVQVNVADSVPVLSADIPANAVEGESMAIDASATLPSSAEAVAAYEVDCDFNGTGFVANVVMTSPLGLACVFERGGDHVVAVRARDAEFEYGGPVVATVTVSPVNDAPEFAPGRERYVAPDTGPSIFASWISAIRPGPVSAVDEADQQVSLELIGVDNPGLFAIAPVLADDGSLSFTPAAGVTGSSVLTYRACDDGPVGAPHVNCSGPAQSVIGVSTGTDLEVAIDNHRNGVLADETIVYAVVVANAGPNPVEAARVTTAMSASLPAIGWMCVQAQSTATCPTPDANAGALDALIDLGVGQYLRFDLMATVGAGVGVPVSATATIATPMGVTSLVAENDSASDRDSVVPVGIFSDGFEGAAARQLVVPVAADSLH